VVQAGLFAVMVLSAMGGRMGGFSAFLGVVALFLCWLDSTLILCLIFSAVITAIKLSVTAV
jgi:hypothetical protein